MPVAQQMVRPPPVKVNSNVQSPGAELRAGEYGPLEPRLKIALTLLVGNLLMLMIAPSVSTVADGKFAAAKRFVQLVPEFCTQLAKTFAKVLYFG